MRVFTFLLSVALVVLVSTLMDGAAHAEAPRVEVRKSSDGWQLYRGGEPYEVRGVGGNRDLELLASIGGNSIRTWGQGQLDPRDADGRSLLDDAHDQGITVCAGYWVLHPRHGFDYSDEAAVQRQRDDFRAFVERWKHHPAVLVWAIGNEVEIGVDPAEVFPEINRLAQIAKEVDPTRPTLTVLAGVWGGKTQAFMEHCPDVDILGTNAYSGLTAVRDELDAAGYAGPVMIGEFGPPGHWETDSTDWGAPIEPSSSQKAAHYARTYDKGVAGDPDVVGSYVFLWGHKQERTATWYGMFLPTGELTESIETMAERWGGMVQNRAPRVGPINLTSERFAPGAEVVASAQIIDPDGDPLDYDWFVEHESTDRRVGGDAEQAPDRVALERAVGEGARFSFTAPREPGQYRVFVIVRDGNGSAGTANLPFIVE
ncbi:MAG: glycoside hydrolase family 2 TIM barrel-domain containing protein [Planctomycetota bacterium]